MELNREQIIKALECFHQRILDTHLADDIREGEMMAILDALSLIKELNEKNERLRCVGIPDYEVYIRLSDAKHAIMDYIGEQTVSKYVSEAECKAARGGAEGAMNELDYLTPAKVAPIADTVRKMQERLKARKVSYGNITFKVVPIDDIDQIAKEMLEEGK